MHDSAVKQVGNRGETDVWVGSHIQALARKKLGRPHLIEENKGTDHLPLVARQGAENPQDLDGTL
jgi:hypothetical protein